MQVSVAAGRVSFMLGLQGPSMGVDTACSASLVATHLGRSALLTGHTEAAVAAGVHIQCTPTSTHYLWAANMLSPVGRCQVLDSSADGYVRGEACHSLVLRAINISQGLNDLDNEAQGRFQEDTKPLGMRDQTE